MTEEIQLKSYREVLDGLNPARSHLLMGNGFNRWLGIETSYENIFNKMLNDYPWYKDVKRVIEKSKYNIEDLIWAMQQAIQPNQPDRISDFLKEFIENKIKYDFMRAMYSIVKQGIGKIYQENNEPYLLLKKFSNYFTLNYDPCLYLFLMRFGNKKDKYPLVDEEQYSLIDNRSEKEQRMHEEISRVYDNGVFLFLDDPSQDPNKIPAEGKFQLSMCKETSFINYIKEIFDKRIKNQECTPEQVESIARSVWQEKHGGDPSDLPADDSFRMNSQNILVFKALETQNVFSLHGSLYIVEDRERIRKITKTKDRAFYEELEKVVLTQGERIVCVLAGESAKKEKKINTNDYLKKGLKKLASLSGDLMIIGCALNDNDSHIFRAIRKSPIETIYISFWADEESPKSAQDKDYYKQAREYHKQAEKHFRRKKIVLFHGNTMPGQQPTETWI